MITYIRTFRNGEGWAWELRALGSRELLGEGWARTYEDAYAEAVDVDGDVRLAAERASL